MSAQAGFLSRHLTTTGNWRISQLDALVFTSLRFPFLEHAPQWLDIGITGLRNAIATQFLRGYLGRKNDAPPGHQLIWQGYTALRFMSRGFALSDE